MSGVVGSCRVVSVLLSAERAGVSGATGGESGVRAPRRLCNRTEVGWCEDFDNFFEHSI